MDPAESPIVEEDTRSIIPVCETVTFLSGLNDERPAEIQILLVPALPLNAYLLGFGDINMVFSTATATVVTAPVLNHRQLQLGIRHVTVFFRF